MPALRRPRSAPGISYPRRQPPPSPSPSPSAPRQHQPLEAYSRPSDDALAYLLSQPVRHAAAVRVSRRRRLSMGAAHRELEVRGSYLLLLKPVAHSTASLSLRTLSNLNKAASSPTSTSSSSSASSNSHDVLFVMRLPTHSAWHASMSNLTYTFPSSTSTSTSPTFTTAPFATLTFSSPSSYLKFASLLPLTSSTAMSPPIATHVPLPILGHGATAQVRVLPSSSSVHAVKLIPKADALDSPSSLRQVVAERNAMLSLRHTPYILHLSAAYQTSSHLALVSDFAALGDLHDVASRLPRGRAPERVARQLFAELVLALGAVHRHGMLFRDLKLGNVFVTAAGRVRLGDFGLVKHVGVYNNNNSDNNKKNTTSDQKRSAASSATESDDDDEYAYAYDSDDDDSDDESTPILGRASSFVGTRRYMSPELCAAAVPGPTPRRRSYGAASDVWALGVILYVLLTGSYPFSGPTSEQGQGQDDKEERDATSLFISIQNDDIQPPAGVSKEAAHLVAQLLTRDALDRVDLATVRRHPWLAGVDWRALRADPHGENRLLLDELARGQASAKGEGKEISERTRVLYDEKLEEEERSGRRFKMDHVIGFEVAPDNKSPALSFPDLT